MPDNIIEDGGFHSIIVSPTMFNEIVAGDLTFMIQPTSRAFRLGDMLILHEADVGVPTGQSARVKVNATMENVKGLERGYCVVSFKHC